MPNACFISGEMPEGLFQSANTLNNPIKVKLLSVVRFLPKLVNKSIKMYIFLTKVGSRSSV